MAFSSAGAGLTAEDFAWVFETCGAVGPLSASLSDDLFSEHRWIYLLTPSAAEGETENSFSRRERESRFTELLDMLTESGAIMRIIARAGRSESRGEILLSLPQQLTLRMRTMLALTFPNTRPAALTAEWQACGLLPEYMLGNSMTELICALTKRDREKDDTDDLSAIDGELDFCFREDDEETYTPLEELELSIRTYNCLKRAGIYSVERLRALKDEDLRNIRNLGYKSMDEIKQKLAEIPPLSKPLLPAKENYREILDGLIGLDHVKQQVAKIAAFARMKQDMAALGHEAPPIVLNMEFTGNPGTAKTTVARIMSGILYETGVLPNNELIEVGRADLVGKYVGHTADKVKEIFKQAKGKLLFIDEAYSLVENRRGDYGDEAINTIVQEMENCREDTVVIFAGYPDEMKEFFSRNPGLRSRVPFTIHFSDYSADELAQIAEAEAKKRGFSISSAAAEKLLSICRVAAQQPKLGNGRFCRNLIEDAILGYASRAYGGDGSPAARDFVLMADDFAVPDTFQFASEQPRRIGFGVKE
ncbi:MAG: AAA family ATPase [Firmicutes bacterium]|nr:AAA family ATPase [Bacillota bacterium]